MLVAPRLDMRRASTARRAASSNVSTLLVVLLALALLFSFRELGRAMGATLDLQAHAGELTLPTSRPPDLGSAAKAAVASSAHGVARTARKLAALSTELDAPLGLGTRVERNAKLLRYFDELKDLAEARALREVEQWTDDDIMRHFWRPGQARDTMARALSRQYFDRHDRRMRNALKYERELLMLEKRTETAAEIARLQQMQREVLRSGLMNYQLGNERPISLDPRRWRKIPRFVQLKFGGLANRFDAVGWLAEKLGLRRVDKFSRRLDSDLGILSVDDVPSGALERLDPVDSTMWRPVKDSRTTPEAIYDGPWMKRKQRPVLPEEDTVLELFDFRSLDADGGHPSVFVLDPKAGHRWKLKFLGQAEFAIAAEAVKSRIYALIGYHTMPVYRPHRVRVDPGVALAAFKYTDKMGIRVREGGLLNSWFNVDPGKYGLSRGYKIDPHVAGVKLGDELFAGAEALELLRRSQSDLALRRKIEYVELENITLSLKGESGFDSIGPFEPDADTLRETRAQSSVSIDESLFDANDYRFNNVKLLARSNDDGQVELVHSISDAGAGLALNIPWETGIDPDGRWVHSDPARYTLRTFDGTTPESARWKARLYGELSEEQWAAAIAAGTNSYPVFVNELMRMGSRRTDLLRKFGVADDYPLYGPAEQAERLAEVAEQGTHTVRSRKKKRTRTIQFPDNRYAVRDGRVIVKAELPSVTP